MCKVDIEKDYLIVYKDLQGRFVKFEWFPSYESNKEGMENDVISYNSKPDVYKMEVEMVSDKLIREICAMVQNKINYLEKFIIRFNEEAKNEGS